ncbi:MAG: hypothetical protein LHV68_04280 [Elusimicrobia bacterium]|nr:hypothetical protein [Candidatus Liberimonas magnetica]
MTLHTYGNWYSNYKCPSCSSFYIPYNKKISCPKCSKQEEKENDFIKIASASLQFNLKKYNSYAPTAWYTGCFSDHVMNLLFGIFEGYREKKNEIPFVEFVKEWIDKTALPRFSGHTEGFGSIMK